MSTHDLTPDEPETAYPDTLLNPSFEVEIMSGQRIFDYQHKPGICQKQNASYLTRKMWKAIQ